MPPQRLQDALAGLQQGLQIASRLAESPGQAATRVSQEDKAIALQRQRTQDAQAAQQQQFEQGQSLKTSQLAQTTETEKGRHNLQLEKFNIDKTSAQLVGKGYRFNQMGDIENIPSNELSEAQKQTIASQRAHDALSQDTLANKKSEFTQTLGEKVREFNSTDDYKRWHDELTTDSQKRIADMKQSAIQNKAPAALFATATFAKGGLDRMSSAEQTMDRLEKRGVMGSVPTNKLEDWIFGKGLVDPSLDAETQKDIGSLRAALGYTSTAAMRAHTGRTSQEIYSDFKTRLGPDQGWTALRGAMGETKSLLTDYALSASDESIAKLRAGDLSPAGSGSPKAPRAIGDKVTIRGKQMAITAVHPDGTFDAK